MWNNELVEELVQASSHLGEMLNNTLDISKLEAGKVEFNIDYHPPSSIVDMVLSVCRPNVNKRGIKLAAHYAPAMPRLIEMDKSRVTQIVMNLVGNAIKFAPEGTGQVEIGVRWRWHCARPDGNCEKCDGYLPHQDESIEDIAVTKALPSSEALMKGEASSQVRPKPSYAGSRSLRCHRRAG